MRCYDPNTDQIIGCKEGTLSYYHEEGHQRQFKSGVMGTAEMFSRWAIYLFLFMFALIQPNNFFMILFFVVFAPEMYLEVDAWIYAIKKKKVEKND